MTQIEFVKNKLKEKGFITRNEALRNYISRLGAIIHLLKKDGWIIETERIKTKKPDGGDGYDYKYKLVSPF